MIFSYASNGPKWKTDVVQTAVGTDSTALLQISLLRDNRSDTASRQAGRTRADEDSEFLEELSLLEGRLHAKEVVEDADDGEQLVRWVAV